MRDVRATRESVVIIAPGAGGLHDTSREAARRLAARGFAVRTIAVDRTEGSVLGPVLRTLLAHRRVLRDADVVHAEFGRLDGGVFWTAAAVSLVRPVVAVAHDAPAAPLRSPVAALLGTRGRWRRRLVGRVLGPLLDRRLLAAFCGRVGCGVVLTPAARDGWRRSGPARILVAPHGADPPAAPATAPSAGGHVLFAGFLGPSKGLDVLVEAWPSVASDGALPLLIAGEPATEDDALWAAALRARTAGEGSGVRWLGAVDDARWRRLFAEAAIVVLPYRSSNPASGVLVRAMAEGRPVIATDVTAVRGLGPNGPVLLVPVGDARALAVAIARLLDDPALRDDLGRRAGEFCAATWSWDEHVDVLVSGYRVARDHRPRRRRR